MSEATDRRAESRLETHAELECFIGGKPVDVVLRNLSTGGAMVEVRNFQAQSNDTVLLKIVGLTSLIGRVCWQDRGLIGFEFKNSLHPSVVGYLGFPKDGPDAQGVSRQKVA